MSPARIDQKLDVIKYCNQLWIKWKNKYDLRGFFLRKNNHGNHFNFS